MNFGFSKPQSSTGGGFGFGGATSSSSFSFASASTGQQTSTGFGAFGATQSTGGGFGAPSTGGGFGGFGASTGGGFGAPSTGGGFGGFGATQSTGGGFGAPSTGGGFGAPSTGGGFGGFGASTGGGFGAPSTGGGFGGFGANTGGGFGGFGANTGGGFGAPSTGGGFGGFGSPSTAAKPGFGSFGFGGTTGASSSPGMFGSGGSGFGGGFGGQPGAAMANPQAAQASSWKTHGEQPPKNITWRTQFKHMPPLVQAKIKQHQKHVNECKQQAQEIWDILHRRQNGQARFQTGREASNTNRETSLNDKAADVRRNASRLRHWLSALKASLKYDRRHLDKLQQEVDRNSRYMQTLRSNLHHHGVAHWGHGVGGRTQGSCWQYFADLASDLEESSHEMEAVMVDLEEILEGSIARPSSYPPELIEQVFWQSESFWNAMSAKVAALHSQAERSRELFMSLARTYDPHARDVFSQSEAIKVILQVSVTGLKFNQERFRDALAHKVTVKTQRLRILQVDPMDNAVIFCIEEGDQPGFPSSQVANTLRRLFAEGDVQLALEPIFAFSIQIGLEDPIIHPSASPHLEEAIGLDAHLVQSTTKPPVAAQGAAPTAAAGPFGSTSGAFGSTSGGFGGSTASTFGSSTFGASTSGGFGASTFGQTGGAFGSTGGVGGFGSSSSFGTAGATAGASTGGGFGFGGSTLGGATGGGFGAAGQSTGAGFGGFGGLGASTFGTG